MKPATELLISEISVLLINLNKIGNRIDMWIEVEPDELPVLAQHYGSKILSNKCTVISKLNVTITLKTKNQ